MPSTPAVADRKYPKPALSLREITAPVRRRVGSFDVEVRPDPLTVIVTTAAGRLVQELVFEADGSLSFKLDAQPVLGMGEGGPRPEQGKPWREQPVQFDRRGALDTMEPRWQSDMYGSRNPVAMLLGTGGWGLFVATPWVHVDLRDADRGVFLRGSRPATEQRRRPQRNQQQNLGKGLPPVDAIVPGLYDFFVFDARDPARPSRTSPSSPARPSMPPKWALGYMQSHRTLEDDTQMLGIIDTFRSKQIPLDAVIYLGTGFTPRGWNTRQPSFDFNPDVFKRDPQGGARRHARAPREGRACTWCRGIATSCRRCTARFRPRPARRSTTRTSRATGSSTSPLVTPASMRSGPTRATGSICSSASSGISCTTRGSCRRSPNVRPWSLQRNGYPGIAQWGGWVWSGDTETSWKTLEAQIAVGLNYSLSIGPYWGSDIGGFYPNSELTGELYARWFQFAAFCGSFRSHGRTWWTRLPWGWGGSDMGPREYNNTNAPIRPTIRATSCSRR